MVKNKETIEKKSTDYESYINATGEEVSEHHNMYDIIEESQRDDFLTWEKKVRDGYMQNFIPYGRAYKYGLSYGELDNDILIKALQNDIRIFLNTLGTGFSGEIKIVYKAGRPYSMNANFETANNTNTFEKLKEFINDYGFVGHKKYGDAKTNLYGEKLYKYTDKDWTAYIKNDDGDVGDYSAKKNLK